MYGQCAPERQGFLPSCAVDSVGVEKNGCGGRNCGYHGRRRIGTFSMKKILSKPHVFTSLLIVIMAYMLSGCAQYAKVSETNPTFRLGSAVTRASLLPVRTLIQAAMGKEKKQPKEALGDLLAAADQASRQLSQNPQDKDAMAEYNFAVARVLGTIKKHNLTPWQGPISVPSQAGNYMLTYHPDKRGKNWNPALYDFTPADQFDVAGTYIKEHTVKDGLGAPIVAVGKEKNATAKTDYSLPRIYYGVTALIRFEGNQAVIGFEDPLSVENVKAFGKSFPLAADFTVPLAVMLASTDPKKLELSRLLRPEKYAETARIARLQPYDPEKTVVLVIHGLMDSPATWAPMLNDLRGDAKIREKYQFWFYSYPSGYPYPYSAAILRRELDAIGQRFPLRKKMVVIGHSMGGCISRLLITDTGDIIWKKIFNKTPEKTNLTGESRKLLEEALIFEARPEIARVVFISAPLRGSEMASHWMGRLGSWLVKSPVTLLKVGNDALQNVTFQGDDLALKRIPNSVDTLAPNNRFVKAIQTIPFKSGIPYHVICGDRGKGGNPDKTKPVRSDGIVPYWSSHLEGAVSERIVPSGHSAHQNPQAIEEVKRILKEHRALPYRR